MAVLLDIKNATERYGDQTLLDDASATITDDGKVGFIGRNGAGKSTLLRVILGEGGARLRRDRPPPEAPARLPAAARPIPPR